MRQKETDKQIEEDAQRIMDKMYGWIPRGTKWLQKMILLGVILVWAFLIIFYAGGIWVVYQASQEMGYSVW